MGCGIGQNAEAVSDEGYCQLTACSHVIGLHNDLLKVNGCVLLLHPAI
ncbi:hypothetical protein [uncultured Methanobrevibacter sp.]|nr:hypothetical protein [uncultured Methanobrevibacter sp.]